MLYQTWMTVFLISITTVVHAGSFHRESFSKALQGMSLEKRAERDDPCLGCGDNDASCRATCDKFRDEIGGRTPHPVCYMRQTCFCGFEP
ncbi:hypothetical protein BDA99DRAFT_515114 [Phascolomyces articulosus]|uniref:Uncharacterized protein n=1 Tax=Phascolomyces articulosus TaxID=60185 RepID=A0AAD5JWJ2_9FUNG|nr:hypothetical protein BDA99DRAFT_515114 [Phascolomyces articulosus]